MLSFADQARIISHSIPFIKRKKYGFKDYRLNKKNLLKYYLNVLAFIPFPII